MEGPRHHRADSHCGGRNAERPLVSSGETIGDCRCGRPTQNAAQRVADIAAAGVPTAIRLATSIDEDPAMVQAMRTPGKPLTPEARTALRRVGPDTTLPMKMALLDLQGRSVEGVTPELVREGPVERFAPVDQPTIHPFRAVNGVLEYVIAVPVRDSGRVIGQFVQWRRVTRVTTSLRLISDLIGNNASC